MDSRDLKVFVAVYEERNVSRAAKKVFLSPQGCSKVIQRMEGELGAPLFTRCHYGVEPTPQGDALYQKANTVIGLFDNIKEGVVDDGTQKHTLNVASIQGISAYLTRLFFRDLEECFSGVNVHIIESPDAIVKKRLTTNEVELGIISGPVDLSVFQAIPFTRYTPCLVINRENPLAKKEKISFSDLEQQPLALVSREFAFYHLIVNRLVNEGVNLDIMTEAAELDYCHRLAEENEAIAVSCDYVAWANRKENTVIRRFEDEDFVCETFIVYLEGTELSPQAHGFCNFAIEWVRDHNDHLFTWPEDCDL